MSGWLIVNDLLVAAARTRACEPPLVVEFSVWKVMKASSAWVVQPKAVLSAAKAKSGFMTMLDLSEQT